MSNEISQFQVETQAVVRPNPSLQLQRIALFNPNGTVFTGAPAAGVHVAPVTTANATDLTTAEALANANKTTLNALIASLQTAGFLAAT